MRTFWARFLPPLLLNSACLAQIVSPTAPLELPLRNLLIEVRQQSLEEAESDRRGASADARIAPGQSSADVSVELSRREQRRNGHSHQRVLVLNGRPAALRLGHDVPLRLRQTIVRNGVQQIVPGTVWLQAGTGFMVTPFWEGGSRVLLSLDAVQGRPGPSAQVATTLALPLEVWTTIADSDDVVDRRQSGVGLAGSAQAADSGRRQVSIQVRISLR